MSRDFSGFDAERIIENCVDSGVLANKILPVQQRWSMAKLVGYLVRNNLLFVYVDLNVRNFSSRWTLVKIIKYE